MSSFPTIRVPVLSSIVLGSVFIAVPDIGHSRKVAKGSSIRGTITFTGKVPAPKPIDMSSDLSCKGKSVSQDIRVEKGKLRDVHVRIKNGTAGSHKPPKKPVTVVQDQCVYAPHVVGAMVGQNIAIKNKDATMHNVHAYIGDETWFNRSQPKGAPDIVESDTGSAGEVFELKCNVHPWMHSYIPITDHPFFDVSASNGTYKIKNVPAGDYTVEAWHPRLGLKSQKIKVTGDSTIASFTFP